MGERKVVNKYYPPDFNPAKIPRRKLHAKKQFKVRTMLSMNIRCNLCGNYIRKGTKFNSRKEETGNRYLDSIKIFRFYVKCSTCCREIIVLTDPQNSDYRVESGASRNFELLREEEEKREDEGLGDPMKALENRTRESKREMENVAALEELRSINSRHSKVSVDALINNLAPEKDKLCDEDEALIKSKFSGLQKYVRRIDDRDDEEEILNSNNNSLKKRKVSGEFTCARRILGSSKGKGSSATSGDKLILSHICAVKKKPQQKAVESLETTRNKDTIDKGHKANNTLQSLLKDYESDEDDT